MTEFEKTRFSRIASHCVQLRFDGEKYVLLLCTWKPAFLKSCHICIGIWMKMVGLTGHGVACPTIDAWHKLLIDTWSNFITIWNTLPIAVAHVNASSLLWVNMKLVGWPNKANENWCIASLHYNSVQLAEHTLQSWDLKLLWGAIGTHKLWSGQNSLRIACVSDLNWPLEGSF